MISIYIKELLKSHNRVIVPDLGAFLKKSENADQVYFNEFLRFNDGLLVDYLSEKENIDKIEAAKKLKKYVAEINNSLKGKQPVDLKEIGTLSLDNNDKIQLKVELLKVYAQEGPVKEKNELIIDEVKENIKDKPVEIEKKVTEKKITDKKVTEKKVSDLNEKIIVETPKAEKPTEKLIVESQPEIKEKVQPEKVVLIAKEPPVFEPITSNNAYVDEEKTGSRSFLWLGLVVILMLMVLAWLYVIKPRLDRTPDIIADTTNVVNNNDTITPLVKKESEKPEFVTMSGTGKYYIVAGCFVMESNADNLVKSLNNKGYKSEKFTKIKELYFVSIASFSDKASAEKELKLIHSKGFPDCWIKKY